MFMPAQMFSDMIFPERQEKGPGPGPAMRMDVIEKEDSYEVSAELPGFSKEDISIELKMGSLIISASRSEEKQEGDKYIRKERTVFSCKRSIYIGAEYGPEDVDAKFADGVLTIALPKKEKKPPEDKTIEIK